MKNVPLLLSAASAAAMFLSDPAQAAPVTVTPDSTKRITVVDADPTRANTVFTNFSTWQTDSATKNTQRTMQITSTATFIAALEAELGPLGAGESYQINSATLTVGDATDDYTDIATAHHLLVTYNPATVTWNTFNNGGAAGVDYAGSPLATSVAGTNSATWDLTSVVQGWIDGGTNMGLYFKSAGNTNGTSTFTTVTGTWILDGAIVSGPVTTLIDYRFDGVANDVGPAAQQVSDGGGAGGSANTTTGLIRTGTGSGDASTYGINSSGLVSLSGYTSITATFVVDSITLSGGVADLLYNGMFFGMVAGANATGTGSASLWNNDPDAFGYTPGSSENGVHVINRKGSGIGTLASHSIASTQPGDASLKDGFTVSLTVFADDSWSISSTGLSTNLSDSGTTSGLWSDLSGGVGVYAGFQGEGGGQLKMGRMACRIHVRTIMA